MPELPQKPTSVSYPWDTPEYKIHLQSLTIKKLVGIIKKLKDYIPGEQWEGVRKIIEQEETDKTTPSFRIVSLPRQKQEEDKYE